MKKFLIILALVFGLVALFGIKAESAQAIAPNCGTTAVVKCGVHNQTEMNAADPDAKALYTKLGISTNLSNAKTGTVSPDGTVRLNGEVIATNAQTYGRANRTGSDMTVSAGGTTFYQHTIAHAGFTTTVPAYIFLDANGNFVGAVIESCGNPVIATPKPKPQSLACTKLEWVKKDLATRTVTVKVSGTASNTTITGYKIAFGDGATSNQQTATHTYTKDAMYLITGYVIGKVNGTTQQVTGPGCVQKITFETPKEEQALQCTLLKFNEKDTTKRYVNVTLTGYAKSTTISGYKIDFGDGTIVNQQTAGHTYAKDGEYTITGYVTGQVDGQTKTVTYVDCAQTIKFETETPTTPEVLPDTGAGSVVGIFAGVSALGYLGHRFLLGRRHS